MDNTKAKPGPKPGSKRSPNAKPPGPKPGFVRGYPNNPAGKPKTKPDQKMVSVRLSCTAIDRLTQLAKQLGISKGDTIAKALLLLDV